MLKDGGKVCVVCGKGKFGKLEWEVGVLNGGCFTTDGEFYHRVDFPDGSFRYVDNVYANGVEFFQYLCHRYMEWHNGMWVSFNRFPYTFIKRSWEKIVKSGCELVCHNEEQARYIECYGSNNYTRGYDGLYRYAGQIMAVCNLPSEVYARVVPYKGKLGEGYAIEYRTCCSVYVMR